MIRFSTGFRVDWTEIMTQTKRQAWTVDEFLNWEEQQPERWELLNSRPWRMMVGAPYSHSVLVGNVVAALRRQLQGGPCTVHSETLKVRTTTGVYYPDAFVRSGPIDDVRRTVIDDPVVVVEVLSPSTEKTDLQLKPHDYLSLPSVRQYVIVHQVPRRLALYLPGSPLFPAKLAEAPGESIPLEAIAGALAFDDVFEGLPEDLSGA